MRAHALSARMHNAYITYPLRVFPGVVRTSVGVLLKSLKLVSSMSVSAITRIPLERDS